jgi:hypothetical protein
MPLRYIYLWGLTGDRNEGESDAFLSHPSFAPLRFAQEDLNYDFSSELRSLKQTNL